MTGFDRRPRWWRCRCGTYWQDPHMVPCWSCERIEGVALAGGGPAISSQHSLVSIPTLDVEP